MEVKVGGKASGRGIGGGVGTFGVMTWQAWRAGRKSVDESSIGEVILFYCFFGKVVFAGMGRLLAL